jgi:hypothetical protein
MASFAAYRGSSGAPRGSSLDALILFQFLRVVGRATVFLVVVCGASSGQRLVCILYSALSYSCVLLPPVAPCNLHVRLLFFALNHVARRIS